MGENAIRFSPNGGERLRRRLPALRRRPRSRTAGSGRARRRRRRSRPSGAARGCSLAALLGTRAARGRGADRVASRSCAASPITSRRSSRRPTSSTRRSTGARSAGSAKCSATPHVSVVPLSGVNPEVVLTVAWEISWYQYRVSPESANPVRLAGRGHDPTELEGSFTDWNAHMEEDGRLVPDIARL